LTGAQAVIDADAARGDPPDALHADHVFPPTETELREWTTKAEWLTRFERLRTVVCVTAKENYALEPFEKSEVTSVLSRCSHKDAAHSWHAAAKMDGAVTADS
jgi:hypothetical protein